MSFRRPAGPRVWRDLARGRWAADGAEFVVAAAREYGDLVYYRALGAGDLPGESSGFDCGFLFEGCGAPHAWAGDAEGARTCLGMGC